MGCVISLSLRVMHSFPIRGERPQRDRETIRSSLESCEIRRAKQGRVVKTVSEDRDG